MLWGHHDTELSFFYYTYNFFSVILDPLSQRSWGKIGPAKVTSQQEQHINSFTAITTYFRSLSSYVFRKMRSFIKLVRRVMILYKITLYALIKLPLFPVTFAQVFILSVCPLPVLCVTESNTRDKEGILYHWEWRLAIWPAPRTAEQAVTCCCLDNPTASSLRLLFTTNLPTQSMKQQLIKTACSFRVLQLYPEQRKRHSPLDS